MARDYGGRVQHLAARPAVVIRGDAAWHAVELLDMRAGIDTAPARVVRVLGEAKPHERVRHVQLVDPAHQRQGLR